MKRYWLFGNATYYPAGGMSDFINSFDTIIDALNWVSENADNEIIDWWHLFDSITLKVISASNEVDVNAINSHLNQTK